MTKENKMKKIVLEMNFEEAQVVILSLIESQSGYTFGSATPERISKLREVISNLDQSMEEYLKG
jgi:hypothetical protein